MEAFPQKKTTTNRLKQKQVFTTADEEEWSSKRHRRRYALANRKTTMSKGCNWPAWDGPLLSVAYRISSLFSRLVACGRRTTRSWVVFRRRRFHKVFPLPH